MKIKIGFIGQGWIGKHYADDFESRGYEVVRYALEEPYVQNRDEISGCDVVFVAVPTPTTTDGFDYSIVQSVLPLVGEGKTVVIKSTLLPGTTKRLQLDHPGLIILHSPEFLVEKTAAYDAANPTRNIVGLPSDSAKYREAAEIVMELLPRAPYERIMSSTDAELVKYAGNCFLFTKVLFMNLLYDLTNSVDGNFGMVREALINDPRIGHSHTQPIHTSGHLGESDAVQRGAGGHCFIKDFQAFLDLYQNTNDELGLTVLKSLRDKNLQLLKESKKDQDIVAGVYEERIKE